MTKFEKIEYILGPMTKTFCPWITHNRIRPEKPFLEIKPRSSGATIHSWCLEDMIKRAEEIDCRLAFIYFAKPIILVMEH